MNLVFMGTPDFARRPLVYLNNSTRHNVVAVVTGPDKKSGRGKKIMPTAVKEAAQELSLPILTPANLKSDDFLAEIKSFGADIFVVVAFKILPEKLFTIPRHGSINLHGSLLPKYRGAAPINWALINGESETGLTTFVLKKKVDTGNIICQEKINIADDENFDQLYIRMSEKSGRVIEKSLDLIETGNFEPAMQDNSLATPAPKITPFDCLIDWGFPSDNIINFIRGTSSVPGAYTYYNGSKLKIFRAIGTDYKPEANTRPGTVMPEKKRLLVAVAGGAVEILELLPQGKKKMTGSQFINGYQPVGTILGERLKDKK